ncbi:hypothetical protein LF63_0110110 [Oleiagrimonas soli]|uniref:Uncharacterized protein n=1 Tax=Oleiagrimonas soli TaxID=1543381 RepID=A0A099CV98_9GAMM|nr:hypothetical protein LF63_0110110 [Oleiagrimonas soli]
MAGALVALLLTLLAPTALAAPPDARNIAWLDRITFGADSATLAQYRKLGREGFLQAQLHPGDPALPPAVTTQLASLDAERLTLNDIATQLREQRAKLRALDKGDPQRRALAKAWRKRGHALADQAAQAELLRAIASPAQLREQMTVFWLNHFSVFQRKRQVGWFVADYTNRVIRPHALGSFRDLVMATLTSPAMLQYLDNANNARGHYNENYARELMELHTLGVHAGYTQQDVQALMHILSGLTLDLRPRERARRFGARGPQRINALVAFYPRRHDASPQVFLGHTFAGDDMSEIRRAVDLIVAQPACARFISTELARYFVADTPSPALIDRMSRTFQRTHGDIAAVLHTLFTAPELDAQLGRKFKDPMQFVISAVRLSADGREVVNAEPLVKALRTLGEPLYGRLTPDGWPLQATSWNSSGQMSDRFRLARALGSGRMPLFDPGAKRAPVGTAPPDIAASMLYRESLAPRLRDATRQALAQARNRVEWNTLLLASPDFNFR